MQEKDRRAVVSLGAFLALALACVGFLALKMGDLSPFGDGRYTLRARFVSASGLHPGSHVELAGVRVGEVSRIVLDPERYLAEVFMRLDPSVALQSDAIASIRSAGIIGDKFVKLAPGGSDELLSDGGEITETEPSINLEELIGKYVFEGHDK